MMHYACAFAECAKSRPKPRSVMWTLPRMSNTFVGGREGSGLKLPFLNPSKSLVMIRIATRSCEPLAVKTLPKLTTILHSSVGIVLGLFGTGPFVTLAEAEFCARVIVIRERMESKEQETTGFWYTEEKLKKSGEYTAFSGCIFVYTISIGLYQHQFHKINVYPLLREYSIQSSTSKGSYQKHHRLLLTFPHRSRAAKLA